MESSTKILTLKKAHRIQMVEQVSACYPQEACGLAAGNDRTVTEIIPVTNRSHSRSDFYMDPQELLTALWRIEAERMSLLAIYHSHPEGPSIPSPLDLQSFSYPDALYIIWSLNGEIWQARCFEVSPKAFVEIQMVFNE